MSNVEITHGLIIDTPWIGKILAGDKVWEMRSQHTNKRGMIALIQKGTKRIVGVANIYDSQGPIGAEALGTYSDYHCIPSQIYEAGSYKWHYAWKLKDVQVLTELVPYIHKSGAVIWVSLDNESRDKLAKQLAMNTASLKDKAGDILVEKVVAQNTIARNKTVSSIEALPLMDSTFVPYAKDGSFFCPVLCLSGDGYTVGDKGDEKKFSHYQEALEYLKGMPKAKWRRVNSKGNRGIVTVSEWKKPMNTQVS